MAGNEKLLLSYGFYFDYNPQSMLTFETSLFKDWFTKEKYEVCKKIGCLDGNYDGFYLDTKLKTAPVKVALFPHTINKKIIDTFRLYVEPLNKFNATLFEKRLRKGKWVHYDNEVTALGLFQFIINSGEKVSKLNSVKL